MRLWVLILFFTGVGVAHAESPLLAFTRDLQTLQATFEQVLRDETGAEVERASGTLALQRPGKFRWEYLDPYRQLIVADGAQVWIYDQDLEQVTLKPYRETLDNSPAVLLTSNREVEDLYHVTPLPSDQGARYQLTPKKEDSQFRHLFLEFHDNQLARLELHDNLDQITRIEFRDSQRNAAVPEAQFIFTPPAGVDLIDGGE